MVDISILEKHGYSEEKLRSKFNKPEENSPVDRLVKLNASRIDEGMKHCMKQDRVYRAMDAAFDISQQQISWTLVRDLLSCGASSEEVKNAMTKWGYTAHLEEMLYPDCDSEGKPKQNPDGSIVMKLDLPTFFHIFLPIVASYTKLRAAKLFNDRDSYPLFQYEPIRLTTKDRLRCDVLEQVIQRWTATMGYRDLVKQIILMTQKYGICLVFPSEHFHKEHQLYIDEKGKEKKLCIKEGVRLETPHPSRFFADKGFGLPTINSDTGVEYLGYWKVVRWREISDDEKFWNLGDVTYNYHSDFIDLWKLNMLGRECAMDFPTIESCGSKKENDLQKDAYRYNTALEDYGVAVTSVFHKLVPSEWDLYDYDHPVWHRFVYAGPSTVIHCRPWAYTPAVAFTYDHDYNSSNPSSLAWEAIPFQDMISTLISQQILSIKENLEQVVFVNELAVSDKTIKTIQNLGEKRYRTRTYVPYNQQDDAISQTNRNQAFLPVEFEKNTTAEIGRTIGDILGLMERTLGFTAQEMGGAASHEQSAREVDVIRDHLGDRLRYTGSFIDSGLWAMKRLLYEAMLAEGSDEVVAEVVEMNDNEEKVAKDLGWEIEKPEDKDATYGIKADKKTIRIEGFASSRDAADRIPDAKIVNGMIQVMQSVFSNGTLVESVGIEQLVSMLNQTLEYADVPDDFRIKIKSTPGQPPTEEMIQGIQEQMVQIANQITDEKLTAVAQEVLGPMRQSDEQLAQAIAQLKQAFDQFAQQTGAVIQQGAAQNQQQDQVISGLMTAVQNLTEHAQAFNSAITQPGEVAAAGMVG